MATVLDQVLLVPNGDSLLDFALLCCRGALPLTRSADWLDYPAKAEQPEESALTIGENCGETTRRADLKEEEEEGDEEV